MSDEKEEMLKAIRAARAKADDAGLAVKKLERAEDEEETAAEEAVREKHAPGITAAQVARGAAETEVVRLLEAARAKFAADHRPEPKKGSFNRETPGCVCGWKPWMARQRDRHKAQEEWTEHADNVVAKALGVGRPDEEFGRSRILSPQDE